MYAGPQKAPAGYELGTTYSSSNGLSTAVPLEKCRLPTIHHSARGTAWHAWDLSRVLVCGVVLVAAMYGAYIVGWRISEL